MSFLAISRDELLAATIILIVLGIVLIFLEVFFLPGISVAGIVGTALCFYGIYLIYDSYGTFYGGVALASSLIAMIGVVVWGMQSGAWKRFSLKETIEGKVNLIDESFYKIGLRGKTLSALRPSGSARFSDEMTEVHSQGNFIDANEEIEIIAITDNKIIVKKN